MDYNFSVAKVRALELVGADVWIRLSEITRARILDEELRALIAEQAPPVATGISSAANDPNTRFA